jgi:TetR/AcrR family transcriptional regulator, regulator of autoinduction and epiphytic fitness
MSDARDDLDRRRYDASGRRAKAAHTRAGVIDAAGRVFVRLGFAGATIPLIAAEAGVSVETVYRATPGKAGLLSAAVQAALAGGADRAELPVEQRAGIRRVIDESDPRRAIELYVRTQPGLWARTGPLLRVLAAAASTDPGLVELQTQLEEQRWRGQGRLADKLNELGGLRSDVPVGRAKDVVWTLCAQATFDALVTARGWSHADYATWLGDMLAAALLEPR